MSLCRKHQTRCRRIRRKRVGYPEFGELVVDIRPGLMVLWFSADFALVEVWLGWCCGGCVFSGHLEGDAWEGESRSQFEDRGREKMLFLHLLFGR
jgi:hypothetical protein